MLEVKDILTIIFALYGAILSTILAIREIKKERRRVQVFLDYFVVQDSYRLSIVNVGYRPITLVDGGVRRLDKRGIPVELIPAPIFGESSTDKFPILLYDGGHKTFNVIEGLENPSVIKQRGWKIEPFVRDAQGKVYRTSKVRPYNTRFKDYD